MLKAFADDNTNETRQLNLLLGRIDNIVGKGYNAGTSIFPFSHNVFFPRYVKSLDYVNKLRVKIVGRPAGAVDLYFRESRRHFNGEYRFAGPYFTH